MPESASRISVVNKAVHGGNRTLSDGKGNSGQTKQAECGGEG